MGTLLQDGIDAAKSGRMEEALQLLRRSAEENPQNADVWVWLSAIIDDEEKQTEFLQKALEIDPENKPAQRGMAFLKRKKFIAPKPGETLSDHTRPIGVFKTGTEKSAVQAPVGTLTPMAEPQTKTPSDENLADYDPDTENTIPPDSTNQLELAEQNLEPEESTKAEPDLILASEEIENQVEDTEIEESLKEAAENLAQDQTESTTTNEELSEEALGDQATQVSPVIAALTTPGEAVAKEEIKLELDQDTQVTVDEESSDETEPELDQEMQVTADGEASDEIEPELDQETQVTADDENPEEVAPVAEELPTEHPIITEAKRLKWQLLLFGLVLAVFIIIGILVGSTLKNLISPQKQSISMNIEPIAKQNGVFLLEGQEFRRLNILKAFPQEDAGLVITDLEAPQIILKDQMVTDSSKLKLLDSAQAMVASNTKMLESKIPVLEPDTALTSGRYCISYVLGNDESQAVFWCFLKN